MTCDFLDIFREAVIQRELNFCWNRLAAEKKDVPPDSADNQIRIATVIDEFGSAAAHCAIYLPIPAEAEKIYFHFLPRNPLLILTLQGFPPSDSFPRIFNYFFPCRNGFCREHSPAMDF